jgi:DNA-binding MarR family transcriptional regulator
VSNRKTIEQAHYIFKMGKKLRHLMFKSMAQLESESRLKLTDLSIAQMNLLMMVRQYEEVSIGQLAKMLHVSPPSVSVMVERLVESGMLLRERCTTDRRKVVIRVSPGEKKRITALEHQMITGFVTLIEQLGPETTEKWHDVLQEVDKVLTRCELDRS